MAGMHGRKGEEPVLGSTMGLVLGLLIIVIVIVIPGCGLFRSDPTVPLQNLDAAVQATNGQYISQTATISMAEDSYIVGFVRQQKYMDVEQKDGTWTFVNRPGNCAMDQSCICLCAETANSLDHTSAGSIECKDDTFTCHDYAADFPDTITAEDFYPSTLPTALAKIKGFEHGFLLFKDYDGVTIPQPLVVRIVNIDNGAKKLITLNQDYASKMLTGSAAKNP